MAQKKTPDLCKRWNSTHIHTRMFRAKNAEVVADGAKSVTKRAMSEVDAIHAPTRNRIMALAIEYLQKKRRIVYGGVALNALVASKDPADAFYSEHEVHDVEFYSPDPLVDAAELAMFLYSRGERRVTVVEATHFETYSVAVDYWRLCDVSYIAPRIYAAIPHVKHDNLLLVHPRHALIDYLRILTDPAQSYATSLEKALPRLRVLVKHFTLIEQHTSSSSSSSPPPPLLTWWEEGSGDDGVHVMLREKFTRSRKSIVVVGQVASRIFLGFDDIDATGGVIDVVTSAFEKDAADALRLLHENNAGTSYDERFPLSDYMGHRGTFYVHGRPVLRLVDADRRCHPFVDIGDEQIGSFSLVALHLLVTQFEARVDGRERDMAAVGHWIRALFVKRNAYFDAAGEDPTSSNPENIFRDFITRCVGTMTFPPTRVRKAVADFKRAVYNQTAFSFNADDFVDQLHRFNSTAEQVEAFKKRTFLRFLERSGTLVKHASKLMFQASKDVPGLLPPSVLRIDDPHQNHHKKNKKKKKNYTYS